MRSRFNLTTSAMATNFFLFLFEPFQGFASQNVYITSSIHVSMCALPEKRYVHIKETHRRHEEREREGDRRTDRQIYRQIDRQIYRQIDRERDRERERQEWQTRKYDGDHPDRQSGGNEKWLVEK